MKLYIGKKEQRKEKKREERRGENLIWYDLIGKEMRVRCNQQDGSRGSYSACPTNFKLKSYIQQTSKK